jgi:hypothetical protein
VNQRPEPTEYAPYYEGYVGLVPEHDIQAALTAQLDEVLTLLRPVPEAVGNLRHPPYTWSVKEVVGHLTDGERIFGYRALRISRGDTTPLASFDENEFARAANFDRFPLADLVAEFETGRRNSLWLFRHLPAEGWTRIGTASNNPVSVRALAYIMVGHVRHHLAILRKRLAGEVS